MGQIQSSVNQLAMSAIGGAVAGSVKREEKAAQEAREAAAKEKQAREEAAKQEQINKQKAEKAAQEEMARVVGAKYGASTTTHMDEAELQYRYREITDPKGLAQEEEEASNAIIQMYEDQVNELVSSGWDEDRARDYALTGVDPMEHAGASIPNAEYDSKRGKQANQISQKQILTKRANKQQFTKRLEGAKKRRVRQQSVGGKR